MKFWIIQEHEIKFKDIRELREMIVVINFSPI